MTCGLADSITRAVLSTPTVGLLTDAQIEAIIEAWAQGAGHTCEPRSVRDVSAYTAFSVTTRAGRVSVIWRRLDGSIELTARSQWLTEAETRAMAAAILAAITEGALYNLSASVQAVLNAFGAVTSEDVTVRETGERARRLTVRY